MRVIVYHPLAEARGGGEHVLAGVIQTMCAKASVVHLLVREPGEAANHLPLPTNVQLHKLRTAALVQPRRFPIASLLLEVLASFIVAAEGLIRACSLFLQHSIAERVCFVDTFGCACAYPLARYVFKASVLAYVHYPAVRLDMREHVHVLRKLYINFLLLLYATGIASAHAVACNSTWTRNELSKVLSLRPKQSPNLRIVYPPVDARSLWQCQLSRAYEQQLVVSIGQFRPEKEHLTQLHIWAATLQSLASSQASQVAQPKLIIIGGCRNVEDRERAYRVEAEANRLGIRGSVDMYIDSDQHTVDSILQKAAAGLHTMKHEHFGIAVVEFMAAGAIPVCHNSGGPALDILPHQYDAATEHRFGYLAADKSDFVAALHEVLTLPEETRVGMAERARQHAQKFSSEAFKQSVQSMLMEVHEVIG